MGHNTNSESNSILCESKNVVKDTYTTIEHKAEEKKYKCTFEGCNLVFLRPSRLQRHIRVHVGERCFKCDYPGCDKAYTSNCHLKRHKKTHNAEKKLYKCHECSMYFTHPHNLKRHYNILHADSDKLTCKECNQTFTKKYQFKKHMAEHNSTIHKCEECSKSYTNFTRFQRHKTSHEQGAKQYACTMSGCNEVFGKWRVLCAHLKTQHVNEYKCKDCSKVFLSKRHLKMHSQVHMENRPLFSCPFDKCPRVYHFEKSLVCHIRTNHFGEKYECDICKIKIVSKARLRSHIVKLHMTETRIRKARKLQRKKRKDAGIPRRSVVSQLVGTSLPLKVERLILERKQDIEFIEQFDASLNDNLDA